MVINSKIFISVLISIMLHSLFIMKLIDDDIDDDEIYVLNLSSYQQVQFETKEVPKILEKKKIDQVKKVPKEIKKKVEKIEKIKKIEKKIPVKSVKKLVEEKKIEDNKIIKEQFVERFSPQKEIKRSVKQSNQVTNINNKILIDKILSEYLKKISIQINKIATQSYPLQSIKRREQGTIRIIITLNENGRVLELFFENKKPKRLYKATKKIIESFTFPKPSKEILAANNTLKIKIPVNFILK